MCWNSRATRSSSRLWVVRSSGPSEGGVITVDVPGYGTKARFIGFLTGSLVLGVATEIFSLSRGGMLSMGISALVLLVLLGWRLGMQNQGWTILAISVVAFAILIYLGFDRIYDRLATLRHPGDRYEDRWQIVRDILVASRQFPLWGTGLGTHEFVYPMFDRSNISALATHAENEYAQVLEEVGYPGLLCVAGFVAAIAGKYVQIIRAITRRRRRTGPQIAAFGLGFGLLAICIHSFSDFGQHLPANAMSTAVACALLVNLSRLDRHPSEPQKLVGRAVRFPLLNCLVVVPLILAMIWAFAAADRARRADDAWNTAGTLADCLAQTNWLGSDNQYYALIRNAALASELVSDNVVYLYWLNVYRWHSISRQRDPATGNVLLSARNRDFAARIVDEFDKARLTCPTYGPAVSMAGQLDAEVLGKPIGSTLIDRSYRLAPNNPAVCLTAATNDITTGHLFDADAKLSRYLTLGGDFRSVADLYVTQAHRIDIASNLAGDDLDRLAAVLDALNSLEKTKPNQEWATALATRMKTTRLADLKKKCESPTASAADLAALAEMDSAVSDRAGAVTLLERAVVLDYGNIDIRLKLADLLSTMGRREDAIAQLKICIRVRPDLKAPQDEMDRLTKLHVSETTDPPRQ